jgi:hypothetical protein
LNISWQFGLFYGNLVKFVFIWYIFPVLVCLFQDKSGSHGWWGFSLASSSILTQFIGGNHNQIKCPDWLPSCKNKFGLRSARAPQARPPPLPPHNLTSRGKILLYIQITNSKLQSPVCTNVMITPKFHRKR